VQTHNNKVAQRQYNTGKTLSERLSTGELS